MIVLYILTGIIGGVVLLFLTGTLLPSGRRVTRKGHFDVPPATVYAIVTNNSDWHYRNSLKSLVILENNKGMEIWDERGKSGTTIRFRTKEKRPYSFYSFDMEAQLFTGFRNGEFEADGKGGTIFTATEYICIKNPVIKTLSYLFFNIGKLMDNYQDDLRRKINETGSAHSDE